MARRRVVARREVGPEPLYSDVSLAKFINVVMDSGKKSVAQRIVYGALRRIDTAGRGDPIEIYRQAVENVRPLVEVKSRRVGGATYQIPVEVRANRSHALAMRWIVSAAKKGRVGKKGMQERLADELSDAAKNKGGAVKKKEDVHRMAESNKAFSHYRW